MTDQTEQPADATPLSPTVALIDARLAVLTTGENSIGLQEVAITKLRADLAAAELCLEGCLAEQAQLEADRALLVPAAPETPTDPEVPTDPEETA